MSALGIEETTIPTAWNGLNRQQLIAYAELFFPYRKKLVSIKDSELYIEDEELFNTICFGLLFHFLGLEWEVYERIPPEEIHRLLFHEKILHFLWETYDLDTNLIDTIEVENGLLVGPSDFSQLTFEEMQLADGYFIDYVNTQSEESLNLFISTLYRPHALGKEYGDLRIPFDVNLVGHQLSKIATVHRGIKDAAIVWYESQRDLLIETYQECFTPPTDSGERQTLVEMMLSIGRGIDNFDTIRQMPAVVVYADIKRVITENRKIPKKP